MIVTGFRVHAMLLPLFIFSLKNVKGTLASVVSTCLPGGGKGHCQLPVILPRLLLAIMTCRWGGARA